MDFSSIGGVPVSPSDKKFDFSSIGGIPIDQQQPGLMETAARSILSGITTNMANPQFSPMPATQMAIQAGLSPADRTFQGVQNLRQKAENLAPNLAEKGVPVPAAAGISGLATLGANAIPGSKFESAAQLLAGPALEGVTDAARAGGTILKKEFPEFVANIIQKPVQAVKMRLLSAVDPFSKELTNKGAVGSILEELGTALRERGSALRTQIDSALDQASSFNKSMNLPIVDIKSMRDKILPLFTNDANQVNPIARRVISKLTPGPGLESELNPANLSGQEGLVNFKAARAMVNGLRDLVDYKTKDPLAIRFAPSGSDAARKIKDLSNELQAQIVEKSRPFIGDAYANALQDAHLFLEKTGQLSQELMGKGQPEEKLLSALSKEEGGKVSRLEEIAKGLPELKSTLDKAKKVFVSSQLKSRFKPPAATGRSLLSSTLGSAVGASLGGIPGAAIGGPLGLGVEGVLAAPRTATTIGREIVQTGRPLLTNTALTARYLARRPFMRSAGIATLFGGSNAPRR